MTSAEHGDAELGVDLDLQAIREGRPEVVRLFASTPAGDAQLRLTTAQARNLGEGLLNAARLADEVTGHPNRPSPGG